MQSETIITELKDKWWKNGTISCQSTEGNQGLSMDAVGGIFIVMAIGCGVSFLILLVEVIWTKYKNIKNGNKVQMNENVSKLIYMYIYIYTYVTATHYTGNRTKCIQLFDIHVQYVKLISKVGFGYSPLSLFHRYYKKQLCALLVC